MVRSEETVLLISKCSVSIGYSNILLKEWFTQEKFASHKSRFRMIIQRMIQIKNFLFGFNKV